MYLGFNTFNREQSRKVADLEKLCWYVGYVPAHALMLILLQCILNIKPQLMQHHIVFVFY